MAAARGGLSLRTVAMPVDTDPSGDIFGGWIMSLMDLAAGMSATVRAQGRVATVATSNFAFLQPVKARGRGATGAGGGAADTPGCLGGMAVAAQALWLQAGTSDAKPAAHCQDCVVLAHELLAGRPLVELPAMVTIAERSIFAARAGTW